MIKRPKQVERSQKSYLSNEKYQDFAENQFKTIYDYLDSENEKNADFQEEIKSNIKNISTISTEEKVVGTFFNKPKYSKSFILNPTASGEITINVNDFPTDVDLAWFDKSNTFLVTSEGLTVQGIGRANNEAYWFDSRSIRKETNGLYFYVGSAIYNGSTIYATIFYTKTTD